MVEHLKEAIPEGAAAVRYKPYPEYKMSGVEWLGKVPKHWGMKQIGQIFKIHNGATPKISENQYWNGDINWITPEDLGHIIGKTIRDSRRKITLEGYNNCGVSIASTGSIALSTRAPIGHLAKVELPSCVNQGCRLLEPQEGCEDYWYYTLHSANPTLVSLGQGSTFMELPKLCLKSIKAPVPPLTEQQTIAAFLDYKTAKIDALIAKKKALLEKLAEKRITLISHAVTKGLDPNAPMRDSGIDWLGEIPANWEVKRIKHLLKSKKAAIKTGPFGSQLQSSEMNDSEVKVYNQKNVISKDLKGGNNYVSLEKYRDLKAFEVFPDDLLLTTRGTIGRCLIVPLEAEKGILHPCLMRLQINQKQIANSYLKVLIGESGFVFEHLKLMSNATTIEVIYSESLKEVWLPIPPVDEQHKILDHLNESIGELEAFTHKVEIVITRLQEYRSALITNAVTGKIDVRHFLIPETEEPVNHE